MSYQFLLFAIVFIIATLQVPKIEAQDYYVNSAFPGPGNGSQADPWVTLDPAFTSLTSMITSAATTNITLNIAQGTYQIGGTSFHPSNIPVTFSKKLKIVGISSSTTITCTGSTTSNLFDFRSSNLNLMDIEFSDLIIDGAGCTGSAIAGLYTDHMHSVTLKNVDVKNFGSTNPTITFQDIKQSTISNMNFYGNIISGIYAISYSSSIASTHYHTLKDSHLYSNNAADALIFVGDDLTLQNVEIDHNTLGYVLNVQNNSPGKTPVTSLLNTYIHQNSLGSILNFGSSASGGTCKIDGDSEISENQNSGFIIDLQSLGGDDVIIDINAFISQNQQDGFSACPIGSIKDNLNHDLCNNTCTASQKFDRCYVCGGSSSCVGCDNIPYSVATCTVPDNSDDDNNTDTQDSVAEWADGSPNLVLRAEYGSPHFVGLNFGNLEERTPSGTVVSGFDLSVLKYAITEPVQADKSKYIRNYLYYTTDARYTKIQIQQILFRSTTNVTSGGVTFSVDRNKLKYTIDIANWPYASPANHLAFGMTFALSESLQNEQTSINTLSSFNVTSVDITTSNTQVNINLQNFAEVDGETKPIKITQTGSTSSSRSFEVSLPANFTSCSYDPDFGVVVTTSNSNGGDGSTDSGLIIGLAVGLGGFALLVVVVVILIAVVLTWLKIHQHKRHARMRTEMVNFDNGEQDEEEGNNNQSSSSED